MSRRQYPFWKDRDAAIARSEAMQCYRELQEIKKKLKNVKCPKCGHVFDVE
jgi:uncharacterized OB-fold protein